MLIIKTRLDVCDMDHSGDTDIKGKAAPSTRWERERLSQTIYNHVGRTKAAVRDAMMLHLALDELAIFLTLLGKHWWAT